MKIESNIDGRAVVFHFRENRAGFLARADTAPFDATSLDDAEATAYRGLAPVLSQWSTHLDTPIQVGRVYVKEIATETRRASFSIPFSEMAFAPSGHAALGLEYRMYSSIYREGLSSNRPAYQFFCFYRIIEGITARRKRLDTEAAKAGKPPKRDPERIPSNYEEVPAWLNRLFAVPREWDEYSRRAVVPQEGLGKKVSALVEKFRVIRNEIGHTLTRDGEPNASVDDHFDTPDLQRWLPMIRCIARLMIQSDFPEHSAIRGSPSI